MVEQFDALIADKKFPWKLLDILPKEGYAGETAGTLTAAAKILKDKGAKTVKAAVTHGILTDTAYDRLNEKWLDELIVTDSTPPDARYADYPITVLSVANLLSEAILRIHNNMSGTSLFKVKGF